MLVAAGNRRAHTDKQDYMIEDTMIHDCSSQDFALIQSRQLIHEPYFTILNIIIQSRNKIVGCLGYDTWLLLLLILEVED